MRQCRNNKSPRLSCDLKSAETAIIRGVSALVYISNAQRNKAELQTDALHATKNRFNLTSLLLQLEIFLSCAINGYR